MDSPGLRGVSGVGSFFYSFIRPGRTLSLDDTRER